MTWIMSNKGAFCFTLLFFVASVVSVEDVPCAVRKMASDRYICVCNETYCDTVEAPARLDHGSYYHYMTSKVSPGFTKKKEMFKQEHANTGEAPNPISKNVTITVDPTIQYQTFIGVGASLTDNSASLIKNLSSGAKQKFIDSFFGSSGLEYTLLRVPIACSDFSMSAYTYDDVPGDVDLKYFNLTDEDISLKIPLIKMATAASARGLKLLGSPWTAPPWMKTSNSSVQGYIYQKYLSVWSNYIMKFLEAYHKLGVDIWGFTQGNEFTIPLAFGSFFGIPNTIMLPAQVSHWMKQYMGPMLKESEFKNVKVLTLDDERPFMTWWSDRVFADEEASQYMDGIALHWYFDSNSNTPNLDLFHNNYPDKILLYTESSINSFQSGGSPVNLGDWSRGLRYINNIYQNFGHWVVGYIDWNIALNEDGGPVGPTGISLEASVIINATSGEFYKQPIFYALGHFSKFTYPGSIKVDVNIQQDSSSLTEEDPKANADLIKMLKEDNSDPPTTTKSPFPTRKPDPPSTTVIAIATSNPDGSRTIIAYNPRAETANLIIKDLAVEGQIEQTVDAHSLNSFVYWP